MGHIAKNCPLPKPSETSSSAPPATTRSLGDHQTQGATCCACSKTGHVEAQCWATHPELRPKNDKKRTGQMVAMRKRLKGSGQSPGYIYQGSMMARTYVRPATAAVPLPAQRRSGRESVPTPDALDSVAQRPAKRVHFMVGTIPVDSGASASVGVEDPLTMQPTPAPTPSQPEQSAAPTQVEGSGRPADANNTPGVLGP